MRYINVNQKIAIMQPYFLPYIGYFQLISAVDSFVVYDNIEYSKKGWINRNRFLQNNTDYLFSLPLKKDSDYLHVDKRHISTEYNAKKLLDRIHFAYKKAPYHRNLISLLEGILYYPRDNLFDFIYHSILKVCLYLEIDTNFIISSTIPINHSLSSSAKVIEICKMLNASTYINPVGGVELYSDEEFRDNGIELYFLQSQDISYKQFSDSFVPALSIIDVIAFNTKDSIKSMLKQYVLFKNTMKAIEHSAMGGGNLAFLKHLPLEHSSLGNHSADFENFEGSQTISLASPSKFSKNHESTTANIRILFSWREVESVESNLDSALDSRISKDSTKKDFNSLDSTQSVESNKINPHEAKRSATLRACSGDKGQNDKKVAKGEKANALPLVTTPFSPFKCDGVEDFNFIEYSKELKDSKLDSALDSMDTQDSSVESSLDSSASLDSKDSNNLVESPLSPNLLAKNFPSKISHIAMPHCLKVA